MYTDTGRNDPCPCGSGKKYKHCHLNQPMFGSPRDEAPQPADSGDENAVGHAINWLTQHHRKAFKNAMEALMDKVVPRHRGLDSLGEEVLQSLQINLTEWLLAEGEMFVKGPFRRISEVLVGSDGPALNADQRHWFMQLAQQPLWLYRVTETRPGQGMTLCDAVDSSAAPVAVHERSGSTGARPGMVLGCRIVARQGQHVLSGVMCVFSALEGEEVIARVRAVIQVMPQPENQRHLIGLAILGAWINQFFAPPRRPKMMDAQSGEPMLLITDHYRVIDAAALERALAGCADVAGNAQQGWRREFTGKDGEPRSSAAINPGAQAGRIEIFYRTQRYADEGRAWFDALAGAAVKYLHRQIDDPQTMALEPADDAARPAPPGLPPGLSADQVADAIEQVMRRSYARWADEPIPLLDNKTPRQTIQTAAGLERVKGLLRSYEEGEANMAAQQGRRAISYDFLWADLGLKR